jgi:hypothetical protein
MKNLLFVLVLMPLLSFGQLKDSVNFNKDIDYDFAYSEYQKSLSHKYVAYFTGALCLVSGAYFNHQYNVGKISSKMPHVWCYSTGVTCFVAFNIPAYIHKKQDV